MSLINEALKKAQRQRSLESAPLSSAPSGVAAAAVTTHVRAASHKRSFAPIWFGLGVLALGAASTVLVMRYGFNDTPSASSVTSPVVASPVAPVAVSPAPASTPPSSTPPTAAMAETPAIVLPAFSESAVATSPAPSPAPAPAAAPQGSVQQSSLSATTPAVETNTAPAAPVAQVTPVDSVSKVTPVAPLQPSDAAVQDAKIQAFLNSARITGVRGGDKDARLLMNERVWRPGDSVSPELGLRLQSVRAGRILFTDAQGKTYEKAY